MDLAGIGIGSLWAGLFAGCVAVLLTAPPRFVASACLCGGAARFVRDLFIAWGVTANWSTAIAAVVVVLVGVIVIRGHAVSPVVVISGVLPLGASVAIFNTITGLMQVSSLEGESASAASVALTVNLGRAFTTTLAIVLGLAAGIALVRLARREDVWT